VKALQEEQVVFVLRADMGDAVAVDADGAGGGKTRKGQGFARDHR